METLLVYALIAVYLLGNYVHTTWRRVDKDDHGVLITSRGRAEGEQ